MGSDLSWLFSVVGADAQLLCPWHLCELSPLPAQPKAGWWCWGHQEAVHVWRGQDRGAHLPQSSVITGGVAVCCGGSFLFVWVPAQPSSLYRVSPVLQMVLLHPGLRAPLQALPGKVFAKLLVLRFST